MGATLEAHRGGRYSELQPPVLAKGDVELLTPVQAKGVPEWLGDNQSPGAVDGSFHGITLPSGKPQAILLPGVVLPAELAYGALLEALGAGVEAVAKELELYAADEPPPGYTLDAEVEGILRVADAAGFDRFHLVGYSAGGAASLVFATRHPERLRSLALLEPAWAGNRGLDRAEQEVWREIRRVAALPPEAMMAEFVHAQLGPGVDPPPPPAGPPPPWMAKRPAGIAAVSEAFESHELDLEALRHFRRPVYFALGGLSNPDLYAKAAERLSRVFGDFTLERFEQRHHFDPPHRVEPERLSSSLRALWRGAGPTGEPAAS